MNVYFLEKTPQAPPPQIKRLIPWAAALVFLVSACGVAGPPEYSKKQPSAEITITLGGGTTF